MSEMRRSPLYHEDYRPQLSGHETFPLRYGWLKKAYDVACDAEHNLLKSQSVFMGDEATARFGVGKNMVASIRHWAMTTGIVDDKAKKGCTTVATEFGRFLFDDEKGLDPYMENPSTLWLVHWKLCGCPEKTTWYWAFNHYPEISFGRDHLANGISQFAEERGWLRASATTIKKDVACFVRMYAPPASTGKDNYENMLESPLAELGLIKVNGKRDHFQFSRGPKQSLGVGMFCYALTDFWSKFSTAHTLSLESLMYEPGSLGRVFLLDEDDLVSRLAEIEEISKGSYKWSEVAGLKQLTRDRELSLDMVLKRFLKMDY